jgi:pimeloyl-ACP methyl ester carboxylesterase
MREAVLPAIAAADTAFLSPIRADKTRYRLRDFSVDALPSFDRPSLILTGRLDASVGYRDAWRLMPHMPRATFATLDRAEHGLPIDQQPLFAALVGDWLDRLAETAAHPETAA